MAERSMIGIFGGTFDPVHRAHVETALAAQHCANLDTVLMLPSAQPPHRDQPQVSALQRLDMLGLASKEFAALRVDDRELLRDGPSYTVDTLESIREDYPDTTLVLILGQDAAQGLPGWHRPKALPGLCHLMVMRRPSDGAGSLNAQTTGWQSVANAKEFQQQPAGLCLQATGPQIDLSASQIRQMLARDVDVASHISAPVLSYIVEHGLYQTR